MSLASCFFCIFVCCISIILFAVQVFYDTTINKMRSRMLQLFLKLAVIHKSVTSEPDHWSGGIPGSCPVPPKAAELHCSAE